MYSSKFKMLGQLYRKDMHQVLPELGLIIIISVLLDLGIYFGTTVMSSVLIGPVFLLLGLAALLPLISSFKTFRQEWSNNTIYLLMSLPVSGRMIMGSKLLTLLTQYFIGTFVVGVGGALAAYHILPQELKLDDGLQMVLNNPDTYKFLAIFYLAAIVYMLFLFSTSFFSQVVGRLSRKLSGWITLAVFIAVIWGVEKGLKLVKIGLPLDNVNPNNLPAVFHNILMPALTNYSIIYVIIAIILFVAATFIYDRKMGV